MEEKLDGDENVDKTEKVTTEEKIVDKQGEDVADHSEAPPIITPISPQPMQSPPPPPAATTDSTTVTTESAATGETSTPSDAPPSDAPRSLRCSECHRAFKNKLDLYFHAEECLMEAFENETLQALSDLSKEDKQASTTTKDSNSQPTLGITVKSTDSTPPQQEWVKLKVGADPAMIKRKKIQRSGVNRSNSKPSLVTYTSNSENIADAQMIQGPGNLRLMVSIEKEPSGIDELDPPPELESERGPEERVQSIDDSDDMDDDDLDSFNTMSGQPQVIGALANANDDPYKPKMECPSCGLVLYRHNFATHYRIHTGELPYVCNFCAKRFRTSSSLKVHIRAHTGEKPYHCPSCSYATITKRNLDRHVINHHLRSEPGTTKGPMYRKSRYRDNNTDIEWIDMEQNPAISVSQDHGYVQHANEEDDEIAELEEGSSTDRRVSKRFKSQSSDENVEQTSSSS